MGVFSEIAMEQQNSMFDSSAAFEDDEAFELEEMESLPVPPVGTDTVPVSAASVSAGETALADAEEEPADKRCQLWNRRNFDAQDWLTGFGSRKALIRKNIWLCSNGYHKWNRSAR